MWSGKDGLVRIKRTPAVRKDGQGYTKANKNVIVGNGTKIPEEIAKRLGLDSAADLNSFESLLDAIKKNYGPKDVQQIVTGFIDNSVVKDIGVIKANSNPKLGNKMRQEQTYCVYTYNYPSLTMTDM